MNKQHGFSAVELVLIIVIVGLLGGTGWYVLNKNKTDNGKEKSSTSTTTQIQKTSTNPYEGWKTYTSTGEDLSFRYPESWTGTKSDCVNPNNQTPAECFTLDSPADSNKLILHLNYLYNDANGLFSTNIVKAIPLNINSKTPLTLVAMSLSQAKDAKIIAFNVISQSVTEGKDVDSLNTMIDSQKDSTKKITITASMTHKGDQSSTGYTLQEYEAHPEYQNLLKVFKSIQYN